jgi:hypothetical protein
MQWLSDNRTMIISEYHRAFCVAFDRADVTAAQLHGLRKRKGWKVGPREPGHYAGRPIMFSAIQMEWLQANRTMEISDYHSAFLSAFPETVVTAEQLNAARKRYGFKTGRTGRFNKGAVPWSKGKKLPFNENSARTQFKKGERGGVAVEVYKPIGSERMHVSGCRQRKTNEGFPMQTRWEFVHRIEWEKLNGPIPDGMVLKCLGEKTNCDPSNWELVPRGLLPRLNGKSGRNFDQAPAELKPLIMAVAKIEHQVREHAGKRDRQEA